MTYAPHAHFNNYGPSSYGWWIEPDLVPFTFKGVNFGQCARAVLPVFTAVLTELEPIIPGGIAFGPHDDWAYSATDELPDGSPSFHHYGIAFDLNWRENPMGNYANNPLAGQKGAIPTDKANAIARKYGCEYGGYWSGGPNRLGFKDYMHFECHLSPDVARTVKPLVPQGPHLRRPWPSFMGPGDYFGLITGPAHSHGGYFASERPVISAIQARLDRLGYDPGKVDGTFGPATKAAVAAWQHKVAPAATDKPGQVWADDWKRLFTY